MPAAQSAALQKSPTQTTPAVTGQGSRRRVAKIITADASASRLRIGDSGELPRLKLDEEAETAKRKKIKSPTSQWQWVVLVTVSFSMCALMLLMDSSGIVKSTSEKKEDARARIKIMYLGDDQETPQEYQLYLREAQLARDKRTEQLYYRKVLRLLRSEHLNPHYDRTLDDPNNKGITGQRCKPINDNSKPSDEDLESLLLVLLED